MGQIMGLDKNLYESIEAIIGFMRYINVGIDDHGIPSGVLSHLASWNMAQSKCLIYPLIAS